METDFDKETLIPKDLMDEEVEEEGTGGVTDEPTEDDETYPLDDGDDAGPEIPDWAKETEGI